MISNTSKGHDQQCKKIMFIYLFIFYKYTVSVTTIRRALEMVWPKKQKK